MKKNYVEVLDKASGKLRCNCRYCNAHTWFAKPDGKGGFVRKTTKCEICEYRKDFKKNYKGPQFIRGEGTPPRYERFYDWKNPEEVIR